jgi:LPS export ABC transporter protein LptC
MITRKTRRGIILLALLTVASFWVSRSQDKDSTDPVVGLDPRLNYVLRDFELQFYDENGKPTINMKAPTLRNNPEQQLGTIEQPVVQLNQPGEVWDITADTATVTADKEHVRLLGQVNVRRLEPSTGHWLELSTREVEIEVTPQTATTDQPVRMFDGRNEVNAIGLDLDLKSNTFTLKQQVKATYAVN